MQTGTVSGLWFCLRSWRLKIDLREIFCMFGSHTFISISWMCEKQTSFSHSSTESEKISLDASLRMNGILPLRLWDLVIEVLHSSSNQPKKSDENVQGNLLHYTPSRKHTKNQIETPIQYNDLDLCNVDNVSSNVKSSQVGGVLYIFEDNEAVIKMIIKGSSPTMFCVWNEVPGLYQQTPRAAGHAHRKTQFNRIRNHLFVCRIEVRRYSRTWFMGSDLCSSWKHASEPYRTGRLVKEQTWSLFTASHETKKKAISESDQWFGQCWFTPSNVNSSHQEALLCVFEDNEAVIKMIIKRRSPTMRHVSRTHWVALGCLFERINMDPKNPNQIRWHQKPTRRHTDQGQLHSWWMESSSPSS